MTFTRTHSLALAATVALFVGNGAYAAENGEADEASDEASPRAQHCLSLIRIENTEILDEQHMVFHTVGDDIYLNTFAYPCPGLSEGTPYMVRSSLGRLCDLDIITVLYTAGLGFTPGPSCGIGMFEPITEPQLESLKAQFNEG